MSFQINPLEKSEFEHLFSLPDQALAQHGAIRTTASRKPGFPCRVSLKDAEIGEEVLLVHYEHQPAATPYRASHAVYVRPNAETAVFEPNQVPASLRTRVLSLRAFDGRGMLVTSELAAGEALEEAIEQMFTNPQVGYIHLHYANAGCYAARADRA
jgi:hypothetical protein